MTDIKLTPEEADAAALLEADVRARLRGQPMTVAALEAAFIDSVRALSAPLDFTSEIVVERDPNDGDRTKFLVPLDLFRRLFVLDPEKHDAFLNALDNPPPAGTELKALMKRKPLWQK